MPNYCYFEGRVKSSKKENLLEVGKWMTADYHYHQDEGGKWMCDCSATHHFWRVFDFDYSEDFYFDGEYWSAAFFGDCAWSVYCCMCNGVHTYQQDSIEARGKANKGITLAEASKLLNLDIEIFSSETGMGFYEHMYISQGNTLTDEGGDYSEYCIEEYETYNDLLEYCHENDEDVPVSKEQFNEAVENGDSYIILCDIDFRDLPYCI